MNIPIVAKAEILLEALPYLRKYRDGVFVFKYGGHAMMDPELRAAFLRDIVLLKHVGIRPVIVHGGGPQIESHLEKLNIVPSYHEGLRVTDAETMKVVEMVLVGSVLSDLVRGLNQLGGRAIGLSGQDDGLLCARKIHSRVDLGLVGEITSVNPSLLKTLSEKNDFIPVISPVAVGENGESLNINADTAACEIAKALHAEKLFFLTDIAGVMDKNKKLISKIRIRDVARLIRSKTITGGMVPKIKSAADAVKAGVGSVAIVDGRVPHTVLLEIFTDEGQGTLVSS